MASADFQSDKKINGPRKSSWPPRTRRSRSENKSFRKQSTSSVGCARILSVCAFSPCPPWFPWC